jgi:hypothetical protein
MAMIVKEICPFLSEPDEVLRFTPIKINLRDGKVSTIDESVVFATDDQPFSFFCLGVKLYKQPKHGLLISSQYTKDQYPTWMCIAGVATIPVSFKEGGVKKNSVYEMPFTTYVKSICAESFNAFKNSHDLSVKLRKTDETDFFKRKIKMTFRPMTGIKGKYFLAKFSFVEPDEQDQKAIELLGLLKDHKERRFIEWGDAPVVYKDEAEYDAALLEKTVV